MGGCFFFNDTATTEIYTRSLVAASDVYKRQQAASSEGWRHLASRLHAQPAVAQRRRDLRPDPAPVSYTHLRAHETVLDLVCRLLLEKKKNRLLLYTTLFSYLIK